MNEFNFDTESNFIQPSGHKNLEQLFDVEVKPTKADESLRYVPPKTNAVKEDAEVANNQINIPWQTQIAKIVIGFRNGEAQGRVGMAILRSIDHNHRIIVYKSKTELLATLTIEKGRQHLAYLHRQNCYWQFYDDVNVYWSLLFERAVDENEFIGKLKECCLKMAFEPDIKIENIPSSKKEPEKVDFEKIEKVEKPQTSTDSKRVRIKENNVNITTPEQKHNKASNVTNQRSKLLVRLPRMGGQQLPQLNESNLSSQVNSATECSDSSDQESGGDRGSSLTIVGQPVYPSACTQLRTQIMFPMSQATTGSSSPNGLSLQPLETQVMQMMLVENRTQNTELRINMDKLENKIEKVLDKIDRIQTGEKQEEEILQLEEQILHLKKENRKLKTELRNNSDRSDGNHEKIFKIYGTELTNLGFNFDGSTMFNIENLIGDLLDRLLTQQNQLKDKESQMLSALVKIKEIKDKYQLEKKSHSETIEKLEQTQSKVKSLQSVETKWNEQTSKHANEIANVKLEMTQTVKDIMNTLYHNLARSIVDKDRLVPEELLALIGKTIRQDTLAAVAKISK